MTPSAHACQQTEDRAMPRLQEKGVKRPASYVPQWCRAELHKLSKADLMEIAYDYAMRTVGEDAGEIVAYEELRQTALVLARCGDRREPRIQRGVELAREHGHRELPAQPDSFGDGFGRFCPACRGLVRWNERRAWFDCSRCKQAHSAESIMLFRGNQLDADGLTVDHRDRVRT